MKKDQKEARNTLLYLVLLTILSISLFSIYVNAIPSQPVISYISNSTSSNAGLGTARTDKGGYIHTINVNTTQQNYAWKAYVGNVTGRLVLQDSGQFSIYEWNMGLDALGNVYISRNGTVDWNTINCSNGNIMQNEDNFLNLSSTPSKSINQTFSSNIHKGFKVSGKPIQNSTCPAIATYVNGSAQTPGENDKFQEVLLKDSYSNLIYMTMMEQNALGYNNQQFDFQAILAENEGLSTPTTYFFYVELE